MMKRTTIKWRIFKYNLIVIIMLITLTTVIFNIVVRLYFEKEIIRQLNKIALSTEHVALQHGPNLLSEPQKSPPLDQQNGNDIFKFYLTLDRSLKEQVTVLNADYILLDKNKLIVTPFPNERFGPSGDLTDQITNAINKSQNLNDEIYLNFSSYSTKYIAIIKPVPSHNTFGLGWIAIYSSLDKVNQIQFFINLILLAILIFSALVIVVVSSIVSKKISAPFLALNNHIKYIAERNFGNKINMPVDDELRELVSSINIMSEKLESYDKAQKTFLQNVSHEFRTPLMSIQSYAEGIQYDVVDYNTASKIIVDESKRITHLVEDLLYLSRLDSIEESYHYDSLDFDKLLSNCIERINGIAISDNIKITNKNLRRSTKIYGDEEKLSRSITNVLSNCIRYANNIILVTSEIVNNTIILTISDDGPGFESNELPNVFERFYKGRKGKFGLGLSISKSIIEKHNGKISAKNSESGAQFIIELPILPNNI